MKTFKEFREQNVHEGRLSRAGGAVYAARAKQFGDDAVKDFRAARSHFTDSQSQDNSEDKLNHISLGLQDLLSGLVNLRKQLGSVSAQVVLNSTTKR